MSSSSGPRKASSKRTIETLSINSWSFTAGVLKLKARAWKEAVARGLRTPLADDAA